jgi:MFS family permease
MKPFDTGRANAPSPGDVAPQPFPEQEPLDPRDPPPSTHPVGTGEAAASTGPADGGPWTALRHPVFRTLWLASGAYFIANAMHVMVVAWLTVERTASSFLAALVQTAVFLPMFVLSLPAGVLADTTDRQRLMLISLGVQAFAVTLLCSMLLMGWAGSTSLLFLTFVTGCCTALLTPAWNSMVGEILPRERLPQAIVAMSIAYNAARALGPTVAGLLYAGLHGWVLLHEDPPARPLEPAAAPEQALALVVDAERRAASLGGAAVLTVALAGVLVLAWAIYRWPPKPHPASRLPAERLWGGTLAGLRYAWHSHIMLSQLVRTAAYGAAGSALWALLPAIGSQRLGSGASGYGLMMGCLGGGAVAIAFVIGRLRNGLGLERLVIAGAVVFALAMVISALARVAWPVYAAVAASGAAWMAVMSTFNTATQTSAPPWVRSRATALHVLSALGSFALGSAFWGALASIAGLQTALLAAAAAMVAGLALARPFPLRMGVELEVTPAPLEHLLVAEEPDPQAGPVAVELIYRVRPDAIDAFLAQAGQLRAPRRRDGAAFWRLYRDLEDRQRYVERFIVQSWSDYLHQRNRQTLADRQLEAGLRNHLVDGSEVETRHYLAER